MDDNPSLSERIKARYRGLYSGIFYRRFVLGQWVAAKGLVYDFFRVEDCPEVPDSPFESWAISCDYGTANPASFGLWGLKKGVWYRTKEYYWDSRREGRQKTDAEYVDELKALAGDRQLEAVVVDPSAASFIEALSRDGLPVKKADNDVLSGIRLTADMLKAGKIAVCKGCDDALREFEVYCWDEKGGGRDAVKKENDHAMDEIRYFAVWAAGRDSEGFAVFTVER